MASTSVSNLLHIYRNPNAISLHLILPPSLVSFPWCRFQWRHCAALKAEADGGGIRSGPDSYNVEFLRKPVLSPEFVSAGEEEENSEDEEEKESGGDAEEWVDWEDRILEDTVPLVGFVRMILHSGKYESGDRLLPEHEKVILERLLPYHPECKKKIGCGIDYITVGYHPDFEKSRCLFIVRKDGMMVDFSYWKCIKGLIRKNYPLFADSFIFKHFQRRPY